MLKQMRATTHRGRSKKGRAFSPKHEDRDFDSKYDKHIDKEKSADNIYWHCYQEENPGLTFAEAEKKFYTDAFSAHYDDVNSRYIRSGHAEDCKSIDDILTSAQYAPDSELFYIGNKENRDVDVKPEDLLKVFQDYKSWHEKTYPNIKFLDYALHTDEAGAYHIAARSVFIAHDENGKPYPRQAKCLQELGIERPKPNEKRSKYNNEKMTYSKQTRDKFIEIAKSYGYDIIEKPREPCLSGKDLLEYQTSQQIKTLQETVKQYQALYNIHQKSKAVYENLLKEISAKESLISRLNKELDYLQSEEQKHSKTLEKLLREENKNRATKGKAWTPNL